MGMETDAHPTPSYTLAELSALASLPPRTVRYYIHIGLVERPEGETRAARYGARQLSQLLMIRQWTAQGLSLERIRVLLQGGQTPPAERAIGTVQVCSHVKVAEGVEVVIEPSRAGLSPQQVRQFVRGVMAAFAQVESAEAQGKQERTRKKQ